MSIPHAFHTLSHISCCGGTLQEGMSGKNLRARADTIYLLTLAEAGQDRWSTLSSRIYLCQRCSRIIRPVDYPSFEHLRPYLGKKVSMARRKHTTRRQHVRVSKNTEERHYTI